MAGESFTLLLLENWPQSFATHLSAHPLMEGGKWVSHPGVFAPSLSDRLSLSSLFRLGRPSTLFALCEEAGIPVRVISNDAGRHSDLLPGVSIGALSEMGGPERRGLTVAIVNALLGLPGSSANLPAFVRAQVVSRGACDSLHIAKDLLRDSPHSLVASLGATTITGERSARCLALFPRPLPVPSSTPVGLDELGGLLLRQLGLPGADFSVRGCAVTMDEPSLCTCQVSVRGNGRVVERRGEAHLAELCAAFEDPDAGDALWSVSTHGGEPLQGEDDRRAAICACASAVRERSREMDGTVRNDDPTDPPLAPSAVEPSPAAVSPELAQDEANGSAQSNSSVETALPPTPPSQTSSEDGDRATPPFLREAKAELAREPEENRWRVSLDRSEVFGAEAAAQIVNVLIALPKSARGTVIASREGVVSCVLEGVLTPPLLGALAASSKLSLPSLIGRAKRVGGTAAAPRVGVTKAMVGAPIDMGRFLLYEGVESTAAALRADGRRQELRQRMLRLRQSVELRNRHR